MKDTKARYKFSIKNFLFQLICMTAWVFLGIGGFVALFIGAPLAIVIGMFWHMKNEKKLNGDEIGRH